MHGIYIQEEATSYLTLTNVVFELLMAIKLYSCFLYLTLTNVVFELIQGLRDKLAEAKFNFNKCCI